MDGRSGLVTQLATHPALGRSCGECWKRRHDQRCRRLCLAARSAAFARRRAALRTLPGQRRDPRAGCGQLCVIKNIAGRRVPRGFSLSPDGARLFVTNSWDDTLSVIDTKTLVGRGHVAGGRGALERVEDRPASACLSPIASATTLPCSTPDGVEEKRLLGGRGASYLTLSPDGAKLYATHVYPNLPRASDNRAPESEITVIDAARAVVVDRMPLHGIAGVFHVAFSADGRLGVVAEYHPKNLVPLAHLEHGGAFEDTLTLFGADVGKPVEVPLDELERYASQPFGVALRRTSRASTSPAAARRW
jgi:hypothetical protein